MDKLRAPRGSLFVKAFYGSFIIFLIIAGSFMVFVEDNDSIGLFQEVDKGLDPFNTDTDGDGLKDNVELSEMKTSPLLADTDGDRVFDGKEVEIGSSPITRDTDGDGLRDKDERTRYKTSPISSDTDDDGINDEQELKSTKTSATSADSDEDGLADGVELMEVGTDPKVSDTDGDGLSDGREYHEKGTDPFKSDTDGDYLNDSEEFSIGTDPLTKDMDGDGLVDGVEVLGNSKGLSNADPRHKDLFIEVDWMKGTSPHREELSEMKEAFANAPVSNPDNTSGITVHLWYDGEVRSEKTTTIEGYFDNQHKSEFDRDGWGYRHILIVDKVESSSGRNVAGGTVSGENGMIVQHFTEEDATGTTAMHELGHTLGLSAKVFDGVDSKKYSDSEYPSVMNYNYPDRGDDPYQFSSGANGSTDFDDWGYISMDGFPSPGLSEIINHLTN